MRRFADDLRVVRPPARSVRSAQSAQSASYGVRVRKTQDPSNWRRNASSSLLLNVSLPLCRTLS